VTVTFHVPGIAQPGGSKRHVGNGIIIDANPKAKDWKQTVAAFAARAFTAPLGGPLSLTITFLRQRPKSHYRKDGTLKPGAFHEWPTTKPDCTKLVRSTEDALKGIAWRDDAQVCRQLIEKRYVRDGEAPGASIRVEDCRR
jgi:Holliday junction resolvase RusA-like endonuclease